MKCPLCAGYIRLEIIAHDARAVKSHRISEGITRAKLRGIKIGRPEKPIDRIKIKCLRLEGGTLKSIASDMKVSTRTVLKVLKELRQQGEIP